MLVGISIALDLILSERCSLRLYQRILPVSESFRVTTSLRSEVKLKVYGILPSILTLDVLRTIHHHEVLHVHLLWHAMLRQAILGFSTDCLRR
jgi:hypothetical protein